MSVQTILTYTEIDREAWSRLVQTSRTGTWFQTPEAYNFYASMPDLFRPFVVAVERVNELTIERTLQGVCVGYVTRERSKEDERVTIVSITQKGNDLKEKCKDIPLELGKKGSPLTEDDVKELYRLLYRFLEG